MTSSYPVAIGDLIAGKYLVEHFIGEGGMGLVVAARHIELEQHVAIKFLLPQIAEHATAAQRFRREARAAARIRGEHACRVLDVASLENGVPYMVMEYLDGCDVATELVRRRRLPCEEAVDYLLQSCEALAEAHAGGIIHRDLKPGNFFLAVRSDGSRCVKVLDFGVSKLLSDSDAGPLGLTSTASIIGSPLYMSPEQLESAKDVDARTDIWGLGIVLYEMITGRTPFVADSLAQLTHAVLSTKPPSCSSLGISVPEGLEAIMLRALAKKRTERYGSVADLARALVPYGPAHGAVSAARVARLLPGVPSRVPSLNPNPSLHHGSSGGSFSQTPRPSGTPASWERDSRGPTPVRRRLGIAALAVALLVLGIVVYRLAVGTDAQATPVLLPKTPAGALPETEHRVGHAEPVQIAPAPESAPKSAAKTGMDAVEPVQQAAPGLVPQRAVAQEPIAPLEPLPGQPQRLPSAELREHASPLQSAAPKPHATSANPPPTPSRNTDKVTSDPTAAPKVRIPDFGGRR
jgi:serine/threonine-protein kinase